MAGFFFLAALSLVVVAMAMGAVGSAGGGWRKRAGLTGCPPRIRELLAEQGHPSRMAGSSEVETALPAGVIPNLAGSGASGGRKRVAGLDVVPLDGEALRRVHQAWKTVHASRRAPAR
jgi:hypothetical protein